MSDSDAPKSPDIQDERFRAQRIEALKRWVDYINAESPETWGPQQNVVVNAQLDSARSVGTSAVHQQHVRDVAETILALRDTSPDDAE